MRHTNKAALAFLAPTSALSETGSVPGQLCWAATSSLEFPRVRLWAGVVADAADVPADAAAFPGAAEPEHATGTPGEFWSPAAQQSFCLPRSALRGSGGIRSKITFTLAFLLKSSGLALQLGYINELNMHQSMSACVSTFSSRPFSCSLFPSGFILRCFGTS